MNPSPRSAIYWSASSSWQGWGVNRQQEVIYCFLYSSRLELTKAAIQKREIVYSQTWSFHKNTAHFVKRLPRLKLTCWSRQRVKWKAKRFCHFWKFLATTASFSMTCWAIIYSCHEACFLNILDLLHKSWCRAEESDFSHLSFAFNLVSGQILNPFRFNLEFVRC